MNLKVVSSILIISLVLSGVSYGKAVSYTLKELTVKSDLIVIGKVIKVQERLTHKLATVKVKEIVKGNLVDEEITVKTAGKMQRLSVEEDTLDPDFEAGEHVLLFLRCIKNSPYFKSAVGYRGKELVNGNGKVNVYFGYSDGKWDFREVSLDDCIKYIKSYLKE